MSTRDRLIKANEQVKAKQYPQATETLKPILKKKKPDPGAFRLMAIICEQQRQSMLTLEYAKKANTAKPNDLSKLIIARAYRAMGKTDDCISCFMGGFNNNMHPWTSKVEWTAHTWMLSDRMMNHWKDTLDEPILDVHYEKLVADPENELPRLIEFLGLYFDPSCYDFHKSKLTVRTLSYDQVNRPVYTTSSGRYKNYERHIHDINSPSY